MTVVHGLLIWVFILWGSWLGLIELGKQLLEGIQRTTASPSHDFKVKAMSELSAVRTWWWNSSAVSGIFSCAVAPLGMRLRATRKTYLFSCYFMFCFLCEAFGLCHWCSSVKTTGHTVPWCEAVSTVVILYSEEVLWKPVVPPCWLTCQESLSLETRVQTGLILMCSQDIGRISSESNSIGVAFIYLEADLQKE